MDTNIKVKEFLNQLKSSNEEKQELAALELGIIGENNEEVEKHLIEKLDTSQTFIKITVICSLGKIKSQKAIPELKKLLRDLNPEIRCIAVEALGEIASEEGLAEKSSEEVIKALIDCLEEETESDVKTALERTLNTFNIQINFDISNNLNPLETNPTHLFKNIFNPSQSEEDTNKLTEKPINESVTKSYLRVKDLEFQGYYVESDMGSLSQAGVTFKDSCDNYISKSSFGKSPLQAIFKAIDAAIASAEEINMPEYTFINIIQSTHEDARKTKIFSTVYIESNIRDKSSRFYQGTYVDEDMTKSGVYSYISCLNAILEDVNNFDDDLTNDRLLLSTRTLLLRYKKKERDFVKKVIGNGSGESYFFNLSLSEINLTQSLVKTDMLRVQMIGAKCKETIFNGSNLSFSDFSRSNFYHARFSSSILIRTKLTECNLREADLTRADLTRADLTRADLRGADLRGADLTEVDLTEADLTKADLRGANLTKLDSKQADLRGADLTEADLRGADLTEADLRGADLTEADLRGANLTKADLRGANLTKADLRLVDLTDVYLIGANLTGTVLTDQKSTAQKFTNTPTQKKENRAYQIWDKKKELLEENAGKNIPKYGEKQKDRDPNKIRIGCQNYTEQYLLCAFITILLREKKPECQIEPQYNNPKSSDDNIMMVRKGELDIYPAYTWQGLEFIYSDNLYRKNTKEKIRKEYLINPDPNEDEARKTIRKLNSLGEGQVQWIGYLGFHNDWNIVVKEDYARFKNLKTISDLKECENIIFGGESGFLRRPSGFKILNDLNGYGLGIKTENVIEIKHEKALRFLEEEIIQVADGFTTDPQINNQTYRILKDDKYCFGRYYSSIIVSPSLLEKHPKCESILLQLEGKINHHKISEMINDIDTKFENESLNTSNKPSNEKIAYIEKIAYDFLRKKELI